MCQRTAQRSLSWCWMSLSSSLCWPTPLSNRAIAADRPGLDVVVADGIREKILSGQLTAGAHLVEADFAREFEVSNGTIRSALRHLQGEGLVELRPRRGVFVSAMDPNDALELCTLRDAL